MMFSQLLYGHRRRRAMSQEDLARRAGLTARSIRNLEVGSVRTPRPGTVRRLADGLSLAGADRERFESAAVATYMSDRVFGDTPRGGVPGSGSVAVGQVAEAAGPPVRFVVTEGRVTTAGGGFTVQRTHEPAHRSDTEFCLSIRGYAAPQSARRPADLLRAVLDALGAFSHDEPSGADALPAGPAEHTAEPVGEGHVGQELAAEGG